MKKFLFSVGAIMCVALLSVCMSSCDNEDEPLSAIYTVNVNIDHDQKTITTDLDAKPEADANYSALHDEFMGTVKTESWNVDINKNNQDEVLKREDQNAKKKFDEMVAKVNAFQAKLNTLDKTQAKNKFVWDLTVVVNCTRGELSGTKTLDTKTINIHYDGLKN